MGLVRAFWLLTRGMYKTQPGRHPCSPLPPALSVSTWVLAPALWGWGAPGGPPHPHATSGWRDTRTGTSTGPATSCITPATKGTWAAEPEGADPCVPSLHGYNLLLPAGCLLPATTLPLLCSEQNLLPPALSSLSVSCQHF